MIPFDFNLTPDQLETEFRKLKTTLAVENKHDYLMDVKATNAITLLLAVHYGAEKDVELVKILMDEDKKKSNISNRAGSKLAQLNSKFTKEHEHKKDTDVFFGTDFE